MISVLLRPSYLHVVTSENAARETQDVAGCDANGYRYTFKIEIVCYQLRLCDYFVYLMVSLTKEETPSRWEAQPYLISRRC